MQTLKMKWTGIRPVLMSNPQTVDVTNPYSILSRKLNGDMKKFRKAQDEDKMAETDIKSRENDFKASAYYDDEACRFFLPANMILACIKEAAKGAKKGKDIDRSVMLDDEMVYFEDIPAAKSLDAAYAGGKFNFISLVKIPPKTGSPCMKMRAMMPTGWTVTFTLVYDEDAICVETLKTICADAGKRVGVGGWRPNFGRFTVEFFKA